MLVAAHEALGTIGGGHLEQEALSLARVVLRGELPSGHEASFALGPALGQCCGGSVSLRFSRLTPALLEAWPSTAPLFSLTLFGAGHVGRAIVAALHTIPCRVAWVDERAAEFPAEPSPLHITRVCVDGVESEVDVAAQGSAMLVMTHSHALDLLIVERALRRADLAFVGVIGSQSKRARFARQLEARGVNVERLVCPIGLAGITSKVPSVIAASVVAQLLSLR